MLRFAVVGRQRDRCAALNYRPAVEYISKCSPSCGIGATPTASPFKKRALRHRPRPYPVRQLQTLSDWKGGRLAVLHCEQALPLGVDQDHGTWLQTEPLCTKPKTSADDIAAEGIREEERDNLSKKHAACALPKSRMSGSSWRWQRSQLAD